MLGQRELPTARGIGRRFLDRDEVLSARHGEVPRVYLPAEGFECYIHCNPNRISTSATSTRLAPIAPRIACHCAAVRVSGNGG